VADDDSEGAEEDEEIDSPAVVQKAAAQITRKMSLVLKHIALAEIQTALARKHNAKNKSKE